MEHGEITDRQLEALLGRLDRVVEELARLNAREERREELTVIAHELRNLNESLQAITYAALGTQGPQVAAPPRRLARQRSRCRARRVVAWSFALPSATATRPSATIGLCQWTAPDGSDATWRPLVGT